VCACVVVVCVCACAFIKKYSLSLSFLVFLQEDKCDLEAGTYVVDGDEVRMLEPGQFAHTGDDDGDSDDEMMDEKEGFLLIFLPPEKKTQKYSL